MCTDARVQKAHGKLKKKKIKTKLTSWYISVLLKLEPQPIL